MPRSMPEKKPSYGRTLRLTVAPGLAASNLCLAYLKPASSPLLPPQKANVSVPVTLPNDAFAPPAEAVAPGLDVAARERFEWTEEQAVRPATAAVPREPARKSRRVTAICLSPVPRRGGAPRRRRTACVPGGWHRRIKAVKSERMRAYDCSE